MNRRNKYCSAFSLLEVVIALAILTLCILPIVACISGGMRFNDTALRKTEAASLLASVVSDLRSATVPTTPPTNIYVSPLYKFQIPQAGGTATISSTATPQQAFVDDSGGVLAPNGVAPTPTQVESASFCISVGFSPPAAGTRTATCARIMITWPPQANPTLGSWPLTYKGSMEDTIYLDLN